MLAKGLEARAQNRRNREQPGGRGARRGREPLVGPYLAQQPAVIVGAHPIGDPVQDLLAQPERRNPPGFELGLQDLPPDRLVEGARAVRGAQAAACRAGSLKP